jgi:hypothetical protein
MLLPQTGTGPSTRSWRPATRFDSSMTPAMPVVPRATRSAPADLRGRSADPPARANTICPIRTDRSQGRRGEASVYAGSGITNRSDPYREWLETGNKMRPFLEKRRPRAAASARGHPWQSARVEHPPTRARDPRRFMLPDGRARIGPGFKVGLRVWHLDPTQCGLVDESDAGDPASFVDAAFDAITADYDARGDVVVNSLQTPPLVIVSRHALERLRNRQRHGRKHGAPLGRQDVYRNAPSDCGEPRPPRAGAGPSSLKGRKRPLTRTRMSPVCSCPRSHR